MQKDGFQQHTFVLAQHNIQSVCTRGITCQFLKSRNTVLQTSSGQWSCTEQRHWILTDASISKRPIAFRSSLLLKQLQDWDLVFEFISKKNVKCFHMKDIDTYFINFFFLSLSVGSDSLRPHGLYSPWTSPGQNTGPGSFSLLQGIFPTQGLNPGLLDQRLIFYQLSTREAQEYQSGQPIHSPVDLPGPGIELGSPALQADSLPTELSGKPYL